MIDKQIIEKYIDKRLGFITRTYFETTDDVQVTAVTIEVEDDSAGQIEIKYTGIAWDTTNMDTIRGNQTIHFTKTSGTLLVDTITDVMSTTGSTLIPGDVVVVVDSGNAAIQVKGSATATTAWDIYTITNSVKAP